MTEIKINPKVSTDAVQQANLLTTLNTLEAKTELRPLLSRSANVTVSSAPMDLNALVARLNMETADTNEAIAKNKLGSILATVIAHAKANTEVTSQNLELLDEAADTNKQIEKLDETIKKQTEQVEQYQNEVKVAEATVNKQQEKVDALQQKVDSLTEEIKNETDPEKKAQMEEELRNTKAELNDETQKLTEAKQSLIIANAKLQGAKAALAASETKKTALKQHVDETLSQIKDENILRELRELLRIDVSDVSNLMEEQKAERSEEEEKYLDKHSTVRIIQDAISHHDQEFLDTIAEKREEKV